MIFFQALHYRWGACVVCVCGRGRGELGGSGVHLLVSSVPFGGSGVAERCFLPRNIETFYVATDHRKYKRNNRRKECG